MIGAMALCTVKGQNPFTGVPVGCKWPLFIRCFVGSVAFIFVTKTIDYLPLTVFQSISNTSPFAAALLGFLWLGEKLSIFQIVAMLCCFGGITIVTFGASKKQ